MIKKQFTLYLENRAGELARVTRLLAKGKVNIDGISAYTSADVGLVQVVVNNAKRTRGVLDKAGVAFTEQDVVVVELADEPGALADVTARIAESGANINYLYATASGDHGRCCAVISAPNLGRMARRFA